MSKARRAAFAAYGLGVVLALLWVPWTEDTGYRWLWTRPRPIALNDDIVSATRRHWRSEYEANNIATVGEKWVHAVEDAAPEDKPRVRQEAKHALAAAKLKRDAYDLSQRSSMSDAEVLDWLRQKDNFDTAFPEKSNLDEAGRMRVLDDWTRTVQPAKEWNARVQNAEMDYRRIAMELAALTALGAVGLVMTARPKREIINEGYGAGDGNRNHRQPLLSY
jgi:hypothetical protein